MLRLRPSELTLTPDDVEETFRRIALRQASRAGSNLPYRPLGQSGRPILRRGPQRATRDAITALSNIPILQPRQAVLTSVDEDVEDASAHEPATSINRGNSISRLISPPHARRGEPMHLPASPAPRSMQLPFRLGRDRHDPSTQSSSDEPSAGEPRTPPAEPTAHAEYGSTGPANIHYSSDDDTLSPEVDSTDSTPGLRGGGGRSRRNAISITGDATHAPSPLHQVQRLSSPPQQEPLGDPTKSPTSPEGQPTLYLQGLVIRGRRGTDFMFTDYTFREVPAPHTEPRRHIGRPASLARSLSSGAVPSSRRASQSRASSGFSSDDVFGTLPAVDPPARTHHGSFSPGGRQRFLSASSNVYHTSAGSIQPDHVIARLRQLSSDASGASAPYSYYGSIPSGTRYPSSEQSTQDQFSHFQFDGAAASHESSRLTQPANPPGALDGTMPRPTSSCSSIYSSPSMAGSVPHALSPLPSMPYTRTQSDQNTRQLTPGYIEAATAVAQNLQSPLEPYAEHYQRQLQAQHVRPTMLNQPTSSVQRTGGTQARRSSQGHGIRPHDLSHGPHGPRTMDTRQLQHGLRSSHRSSEHLANPAAHGAHMYNRSSQTSRASQRSSENAPVVPSASQARYTQSSRVQSQRAAYERPQNSGHTRQPGPGRGNDTQPFRHSMPQTATPNDVSNRPREYALPQYTSAGAPPLDPAAATALQQYYLITQSLQGRSPPIPPRLASRREPPQRAPTHTYRPTPLLHPPLTALALDHGSGTTSRRSHSPLPTTARTHRRVPPEQRDQENDGDRAIMQREAGSVQARWGEEQALRGEMNETPPRVGRVERRMAE